MRGKHAARSANSRAADAESALTALRARMDAEVEERDAQIAALRSETTKLRANIDKLAAQRANEVIAAERAAQESARQQMQADHAEMVRRVVAIFNRNGKLPKEDWYEIADVTGLHAEVFLRGENNRYERRGVKGARRLDDQLRQAGVPFKPSQDPQ